MGSSESKPSPQGPLTPQKINPPTNLTSDLKPPGQAAEAVKPCCVCKDEKSQRDECMLFASSDDAAKECEGKVKAYKECMRGYGFTV